MSKIFLFKPSLYLADLHTITTLKKNRKGTKVTNNTKVEKFLPRLGFAITLLSLSPSVKGFQRVLDYGLAGIIALAAIVLLLESRSSKPIWKSIVDLAEHLEMTPCKVLCQ
jgi:hypothetical protein